METYMYNTTPTRSTQARFSGNQAGFSPGLAGTASGEIEAFIWRCKQGNEGNTRYKYASRGDLDSSSVTTFLNMLTEVNTRCRKLEEQLLQLQEHTRRVTSQLDSIVSHRGNKSPTSTAHSSTSSMDTMKAIRKLQWKIFDLQRENEALRGVLEVQRVKVDAEGEIANPPRLQEADPSEPWFYLNSEETSTPQDASEGSAFLLLDPSLSSDHQKADLKKEDVTSKEAHQQSTPSSYNQRVVQQRMNADKQTPQPSPLSVQQSGYSEKPTTRSTPEPSSADRRTVVDSQQLNYNINRNPQSISNFVTVDERLVQQMVISDDTKLVHNVEHPHNCINQKNTCGDLKILKDKSPGATSTTTRKCFYRPTKLTPSGKNNYHYSRPPVGREEWRWSSPSTSYPQVSTKSSTKTENAQGIQSCYQSAPAGGAEHHKHVGNGNLSHLEDDYGCSNPDKAYSTDCGRPPCSNELGDLELGEFNLYASPEDIRLVQGTLELLSSINNMGFIDEVTT